MARCSQCLALMRAPTKTGLCRACKNAWDNAINREGHVCNNPDCGLPLTNKQVHAMRKAGRTSAACSRECAPNGLIHADEMTDEEMRAACEAIQKTWTPAQEYTHRVMKNDLPVDTQFCEVKEDRMRRAHNVDMPFDLG